MEQNFETSFIPKKPIVRDEQKVKRPVGLLTVISVLIFGTMVLSGGGLYFYKNDLEKKIAGKQEDIRIAKNQFETERIQLLETLGRRLSSARTILDKHIALTPIFEELSKITRKQVSYTEFDYDFDQEKGGDILVHLKGVAKGYREVALQADLFSQNKNFKEPIFSNLSLDEQGGVIFDLEFLVDPVFVDYHQMLERESAVFDDGIIVPVTNSTSTLPTSLTEE